MDRGNLMNGCSLSRTKRPLLYFIDVLIRRSWLPIEFVHLTVWADRCTWMRGAKRGFTGSNSRTLAIHLAVVKLLFFMPQKQRDRF